MFIKSLIALKIFEFFKEERHQMVRVTKPDKFIWSVSYTFYNFKSEPITIKKGDVIGQGIFMKYYLTDDDDCNGKRKGGFGSTNK